MVQRTSLARPRVSSRPVPPPFLKNPATQKAIERLSEADALTIVVGAGVSQESGLPDWNGLVSELLKVVGQQAGAAEEALDRFAQWSIRSDGLPGAGATAKAWLGADFTTSIRQELYRESGSEPRPGATAQCIARLRRAAGPKCEVVTLNYDTLLEKALRETGFRASEIKRYVSARKGRSGDAVVRHLHGVLTPTEMDGTVVLSESDYHLMQDKQRWQERYMRDRLKRTACLFVGTSLSDPNLLRYLYRAELGAPHVAVFVRQADDWWFSSDYESVRGPREESVLRRWKAVNVEPLLADYFSQSAQFVSEVARRRELGAAYVSYHHRLLDWEKQIERTLLSTEPVRFRRTQERVQPLLEAWCTQVRDYLLDNGAAESDEHLGLHLWVRDPSARALVRLASSVRLWRDPNTVQRVPISRPTNWVAVEAFCAGTTIAQRPGELSRWNFVLGLPVVLNDDERGRLPVGVLTLASTKTGEESGLARLTPALTDAIATYLTQRAARLLTP